MAKSLLLADDSVTIQKVVGISFASEDIEIITVDNGNDAVSRAREILPDVILADVVMPGLSGYEVCEAVRNDPALAHVPVILLTGTFEAFDAERAERAGASGHVSKPFEAQTLVDRVKELLASAPPPAAQPAAAPDLESPIDADEEASNPQAFDFSDEGSELSAPPVAELASSDEPLELDDSDAAFSFEDEEISSALDAPPAAPPRRSAPSDATVVLPLAEPEASAPVEPRDLAQATLLDPASARGFDVSSSDLGPPVELEELDELPRPYGAEVDPDDTVKGIPVPETHAVPPVEETRLAMPIPEPPMIEPAPEDDFQQEPGSAWPEALAGGPADASTDPFETGTHLEAPDPFEPEATRREPEPSLPDPTPAPEAAAPEPPSSPDLGPALRQELSDTLEKIAWDAFAPVTEKIVAQALERIEQVVWEVVPRLAETLIQEEIRRLKDGDPED